MVEFSWSVSHQIFFYLQVVLVLKKEVANTSNGGASSEGASESGDMAGYRQSLVRTLHACSIKFPAVAPSVVPLVSTLS